MGTETLLAVLLCGVSRVHVIGNGPEAGTMGGAQAAGGVMVAVDRSAARGCRALESAGAPRFPKLPGPLISRSSPGMCVGIYFL